VKGSMPTGDDSTLSRQAIRSGYPRVSKLTFDASILQIGINNITFTRTSPPVSNNTGMGWDTVVLEIDSLLAPKPPILEGTISTVPTDRGFWTTIFVENHGIGYAMGVRIESFSCSALRFHKNHTDENYTIFFTPLLFNGIDLKQMAFPLGNIAPIEVVKKEIEGVFTMPKKVCDDINYDCPTTCLPQMTLSSDGNRYTFHLQSSTPIALPFY